MLLLDEPTNHLDMGSRAVLAQALRSFEGSVVLISHDRYFIDEVCDEVWEVEGGRVTPFLGNYSYYLERVNRGLRPDPFPLSAPPPVLSGTSVSEVSRGEKPKVDRKAERRRIAQLRAERGKVLKPLQRRVTAAEQKIEQLELQIAELKEIQCDPTHYQDSEEVVRVNREMKQLQRNLEEVMEEWESAEEALSAANEELEKS